MEVKRRVVQVPSPFPATHKSKSSPLAGSQGLSCGYSPLLQLFLQLALSDLSGWKVEAGEAWVVVPWMREGRGAAE